MANYRRMESVAILVAIVCAVGLGFAASVFGLDRTQMMVIGGLYLIGCLPAILYLHFIAKAQQESKSQPR